jgi:citronellol/citronellal dehydrogenase
MPYRSVFAPGLYAGQLIIVTGGGSGIGRCTAHELAALGAHVVLVGRKAEKLTTVAQEISDDGGRATTCPCDVRDDEAVAAMVTHSVTRYGRVHGLVNNAGGQYPAALEDIEKKGFDAVLRTNLTGGFLVAREVYRRSMKEHGGAIVNIIADAWGGMPGMAHSGAARAGMENLTQSAAVEWAAAGVRVNAIAPGWIASSGLDSYEGPVRALIPRLRDGVPLKRFGTEAEVSAAVCFLLSPAAAFISGATLRVDGAASQNVRTWPLGPTRNAAPFEGFHRARPPRVLSGD